MEWLLRRSTAADHFYDVVIVDAFDGENNVPSAMTTAGASQALLQHCFLDLLSSMEPAVKHKFKLVKYEHLHQFGWFDLFHMSSRLAVPSGACIGPPSGPRRCAAQPALRPTSAVSCESVKVSLRDIWAILPLLWSLSHWKALHAQETCPMPRHYWSLDSGKSKMICSCPLTSLLYLDAVAGCR